jgi:hypothetical protein
VSGRCHKVTSTAHWSSAATELFVSGEAGIFLEREEAFGD